MSLTASILIRAKNEAKDISKALELVMSQSVRPHEIIIVDSGSTDGTVEIIHQWMNQCDTLKLIHMLPEEFTFGRSLNIGMAAATGDVVVSLSAHAFPCDRDWLKHLIQHFDDPQVAGVYGKQVPHLDAYPVVKRDYLNFYNDRSRVQTDANDRRDHAFSNANSAIRRECWQKRPFDETLSYCEDVEWAGALLALGYRVIYEPEAAAYHSHNESLPKVYRRTYQEALAQKALNQHEMGLRAAMREWYNVVLADIRFILQHKKDFHWLLKAPIYRLFSIYGYLRPDLPAALWKPFLTKWKRTATTVRGVTS